MPLAHAQHMSPRDRASSAFFGQHTAATVLLGGALLAVLWLGLLPVLVTGLLVYVLHRALLRQMSLRLPNRWAHVAAMSLFLVILAAVIAAGVIVFGELRVGSPDGPLVRLAGLLADSVDRLRNALPPWMAEHLPESVDSLRDAAVAWLRDNSRQLRVWGAETLRVAAQLLIGLVIGLLASASASVPRADAPPFLAAWRHGLARLVRAFTGVMGAQVRIAAVNTTLTAIYLLVIVPLLGEHMPFARALVVLTFVTGMLPVIGNLLSNSAIVLAALVVSPTLAALSLAFLIAIHKLEYFLNARLVGGRIEAKTYELLAAMLIFEAVFGLRGLIAAPIYYAWAMGVLRDEGWI